MATAPQPIRKLSRRKRLAFVSLTILMAAILCEGLCWILLGVVEATYGFSVKDIQKELQVAGEFAKSEVEALHPYLGWVLNPQVKTQTKLFDRSIGVNSLGFSDEEQGIPKRSADRVLVAVTGGSVAWQLSVAGEQRLRDILEKSPAFRGRKLHLVRLAMSGYKQPQQLMALNYMLALGAEFDVLVNIDGYNEVALAIADNAARGTFAAYPQTWFARLHSFSDPRKNSISFRILQTRATRQQLASDRRQSWLSWSPTLNLIWYIRDRRLQQHLIAIETELRQSRFKDGHGFPAMGPAQLFHDTPGMNAHVVDIWSNCSQAMQKLCAASGITYVHILQPNQYLPGSKPMTPEEREKCYYEKQGYGEAIAAVYPAAKERVEILRKQGVDCHDLTMIFQNVHERVYADPFCHLNEHGNELLAKATAELILAALEKK